MIRSLAPLMAAIILTGCASTPQQTKSFDNLRANQLDRETRNMLKSINESLLVLAETRQGRVALTQTPEEMAHREWLFKVTPDGMGVPISVNNFKGHPSSIIDMIASMTGYAVENVGVSSPDVRNVSVSYVSRPAVEILRSVSYQMECDGMVDVMPANRKIVIDWSIRKRGCAK